MPFTPQAGASYLLSPDGTGVNYPPAANTNADRGNTLIAALADAVFGDKIFQGAGTYAYPEDIPLVEGVDIIGLDGLTLWEPTGDNVPSIQFHPRSHVTVRNITSDAAGQTFAFGAGDPDIRDFRLINCNITCDEDAIGSLGGYAGFAKFVAKRCNFTVAPGNTHNDCIALFAGGGQAHFEDCTFLNRGGQTFQGLGLDIITVEVAANWQVTLKNCHIVQQPSHQPWLYSVGLQSVGPNAKISMSGGSITLVPGSFTSVYAVRVANGGEIFMGGDVSWDHTKVDLSAGGRVQSLVGSKSSPSRFSRIPFFGKP